MQFLGIGYQEILVVLGLMLVVVGPERMPRVAYQIGKAVRTMQGYARVVRDEFQGELDYFQKEADVIKGEMASAKDSFRATETELRFEQERMRAEVGKATQSIESDIKAPASTPVASGISTLSTGSPKPDSDSAAPADITPSGGEKPLLF